MFKFDTSFLLDRVDAVSYKIDSYKKEWHNDLGQLHREDGPAREWNNGDKVWFLNGKLHREDGPAVEYAAGQKYWFYQDKLIDCDSQEEFIKLIKLKAFW